MADLSSIQYFAADSLMKNLEILKSRLISLIDSKVDQVIFIRLRETTEGKVAKNAFSIMGKPVSPEVPDCWVFT